MRDEAVETLGRYRFFSTSYWDGIRFSEALGRCIGERKGVSGNLTNCMPSVSSVCMCSGRLCRVLILTTISNHVVDVPMFQGTHSATVVWLLLPPISTIDTLWKSWHPQYAILVSSCAPFDLFSYYFNSAFYFRYIARVLAFSKHRALCSNFSSPFLPSLAAFTMC